MFQVLMARAQHMGQTLAFMISAARIENEQMLPEERVEFRTTRGWNATADRVLLVAIDEPAAFGTLDMPLSLLNRQIADGTITWRQIPDTFKPC